MASIVADISGSDVEEQTEIILSTLPSANVYKLPPRPDTRGYHCQQWPKENHIFTGRVVVVARGSQCTIRLMDPEKGTLFAQCPLDNDNPQLSVEPVVDSSRYFVIRVSDGSGRYAYLGMGFLERSDAFEFNVTLQDHVKRLRNEKAAEAIAAAPAAPPQDFTLKGSVSIALPGGLPPSKPRPALPPAGAGLMALAPPPPSGGASRGRPRPIAAGAPQAPPPAPAMPAATAFTATFGEDPFTAAGPTCSSSDPFATQPDPFANAPPFEVSGTSASPPTAANAAMPFGAAAFDEPTVGVGSTPFSEAAPFGNETSFDSAATAGDGASGGTSGWAAFGTS